MVSIENLSREELAARLRAAEAELYDLREENSALFELSGVGQVLADPASERFVAVNRAFCQMLGYTEAELLARSVGEISHPEDATIFSAAYPRMLSGEVAEYKTDKRYLHKDGRVVWVAINASLLPERPGQPRRVIAVIRNITPRKEAEFAALESATKFRAIFENSVDAIAVYQGELHALVNPAYVALFGYGSAEELIGTPGPNLIAPSAREMIYDRIHRRMRGESPPSNYVSRGLRKDGSEFDLEIHASHYDLNGERFRLVILRDVTEQRRIARDLLNSQRHLEERVRERTRELTRANSRLARESRRRERLEIEMREVGEREQRRIGQDLHDGLGQQLAGISYMTSALVRTVAKGAPVPLPKLREIAELLGEAVRHTREISRGLYPLDLEEEGLFFAMRQLAERIARAHGIPCVFHCAKEFSIEKSAAMQLYRIAQEAVANALRHGRPARVDLELDATPRSIRLTIADDGIGIPLHSRKAGMGLTTMRNRAHLLGGTLQIRRNPAAGTTVTCELPCRKCGTPQVEV